MNPQQLRPSFVVYAIDSQPQLSAATVQALKDAGYPVKNFADVNALFDVVYTDPPHFILIRLGDAQNPTRSALKELMQTLPETKIFLLCHPTELPTATNYYQHGVYECLMNPPVHPTQIINAFDHAAEKLYYIYLSESGHEKKSQKVLFDFEQWFDKLQEKTSVDECVQHLMEGFYSGISPSPMVFFRYLSGRRALLGMFSVGEVKVEIQEIGLNLNRLEESFRVEMLSSPQKIPSIREMLKDVFGVGSFQAWTLELNEEVWGVLFAFSAEESLATDVRWKRMLEAFKRAGSFLEIDKKLHTSVQTDRVTGAFNKLSFSKKVAEEVARSRRTHLPVSLILLSVDRGEELMALGKAEVDLVMKALVKIFFKHSRVNDLIGRLDNLEVAVLLPHTGIKGAMIKAERLRRTVESADFTQVIRSLNQLTVSLGVSEYPGSCRDAEELLELAGEALDQVRSQGGNRVCVGKAVDGFIPDFIPKT